MEKMKKGSKVDTKSKSSAEPDTEGDEVYTPPPRKYLETNSKSVPNIHVYKNKNRKAKVAELVIPRSMLSSGRFEMDTDTESYIVKPKYNIRSIDAHDNVKSWSISKSTRNVMKRMPPPARFLTLRSKLPKDLSVPNQIYRKFMTTSQYPHKKLMRIEKTPEILIPPVNSEARGSNIVEISEIAASCYMDNVNDLSESDIDKCELANPRLTLRSKLSRAEYKSDISESESYLTPSDVIKVVMRTRDNTFFSKLFLSKYKMVDFIMITNNIRTTCNDIHAEIRQRLIHVLNRSKEETLPRDANGYLICCGPGCCYRYLKKNLNSIVQYIYDSPGKHPLLLGYKYLKLAMMSYLEGHGNLFDPEAPPIEPRLVENLKPNYDNRCNSCFVRTHRAYHELPSNKAIKKRGKKKNVLSSAISSLNLTECDLNESDVSLTPTSNPSKKHKKKKFTDMSSRKDRKILQNKLKKDDIVKKYMKTKLSEYSVSNSSSISDIHVDSNNSLIEEVDHEIPEQIEMNISLPQKDCVRKTTADQEPNLNICETISEIENETSEIPVLEKENNQDVKIKESLLPTKNPPNEKPEIVIPINLNFEELEDKEMLKRFDRLKAFLRKYNTHKIAKIEPKYGSNLYSIGQDSNDLVQQDNSTNRNLVKRNINGSFNLNLKVCPDSRSVEILDDIVWTGVKKH